VAHREAPESDRWYVIRSKPKQEERAASNLRAWGIETFMPQFREPCNAGRSSEPRYRVKPLFPGYLFARFDAWSLYAKVRLTRGVHDIVGLGECATAVDDAVISLVRSRVADDGFVHFDVEPGDLVEIVEGPLASFVGVFDAALAGGERVRLLLTTIGSSMTRVQVPRAFIRKAASPLVA